MKHLKSILFGLAVFIGGCIATTINQTQAAGSGADFTISPVLPEAQADQSLNYFSLNTEANQVYPLKVVVNNLNSEKAQNFQVQLVTATTTSSGRISYMPTADKRDSSALTTLPELALDQPTTHRITVPAASKQEVTFTVTMPKSNIVGTVLGSIYVRRVDAKSKNDQTIGIQNEFAMTIPVMLQQKNLPKITPALNITSVKQSASGGAAVLKARVHNSKPVMFGKINMKTQVFKKGSKKALITQTDQNFEMAPNSTMPYQVRTGGEALAPGRYVLKMRLTSGEKVFNLEKEFGIKASEHRTTEQQLVKVNRNIWWLWYAIGAGLVLIIIGLVILLIYRKRRAQK
ncbi:DUF916 and DUF3324 domain-containing protein [Lapidilactobacillus wuchangensis]|uniref:DUF916 and DUF3324 domain-containing protein n=1 Tax=Lapidilactobacillus wuchangensis TaxID=2486001 RepID=UPI0013DE292E|nr:DUF916 and DUF3324 domain-containing protein [Lapidilactobacillus wuchangensis]